MVNWKFWEWGKKSKVVEQATFILAKMSAKGGWEKALTLAEPTPLEDLYKTLEPGFYRLQKYQKGQTGYDVLWGPAEVTGDVDEAESKTSSKKEEKGSSSVLVQWVEMAKAISSIKEEAGAEFAAVAPMFGFTNINNPENKPMSLIDQLKQGKEDYEALRTFFGEKVSGDEPIKYDGSVPIWLHPKLIPVLIDDTMEKIEKRLRKWDVIGEDKSNIIKETEEELPDFPTKPKSEKKVDDTKAGVEKAPKKEGEDEEKKEE